MLQALDELRRAGHFSEDEGKALRKAYRYWRGVTEDDETTPASYTPERGLLAFQKNYRFFKEIIGMAGGAEDELVDFEEDSEGNSRSSSSGGSDGESS